MACVLSLMPGVCFLFLLFLVGAGEGEGPALDGWHVQVDGRQPVGRTDEDFVCATLDWWPPEKCDYGTCSWGSASLLNLDLSNPILLNAIRAFSPLKLRLGGSLQDKVIYETVEQTDPCTPFAQSSTEPFGFTQGCLPISRWDELNSFFTESGAVIIFGLNALNGRVKLPDGSLGGPWNYSNAASFIQYTVDRGYTIHGWELGNELSGNGVGYRINCAQYAEDVIALKSLLDNIYYAYNEKPLVLAPGGFFDASWFGDLIARTRTNSMDVITHHIYNLGPGVDSHLIDKILNPLYLDGEKNVFRSVQGLLRTSRTPVVSWVGEAGGAYNSGHNLVTNAFVFSFWYLDQLGMAASSGTKTYCRQSLIGGNYGLLNTTTYKPNPDYYSALLWHRLMGRNALATSFNGTTTIRTYAHCAKQSNGVTLLLINLDVNTTVRIYPSAVIASTSRLSGYRTKPGYKREEYHLTAKDGNLHSQTMLLNGKILVVDEDDSIPSLEFMTSDSWQPIILAPLSIVFAHMPYMDAPACRNVYVSHHKTEYKSSRIYPSGHFFEADS